MRLFSTLILSILAFTAHAQNTITLQSGEQQTPLIELFTSEGCSSCPPADNWLSGLKADPELWQDFVPIAFHVDYWDYIGWKDSLALPGNTQRQRQYEAENKIRFVYTPGFVINGQEWQGWFGQRTLPPLSRPNAGILKAEIKGSRVDIDYLGTKRNLDYHVAILGFDIQSQINSGENAGKKLSHDFVALSHDTVNSGGNHASLSIPDSQRKGGRKAIAIWINAPDSLMPIQSVGGWIAHW